MAVIGTKLWRIAPELFEFFIRKIFPMAADKKIAFDLDRRVLSAQTYWLDRTVMQLEDAGWMGYTPGGPTRQLRRVLSVDFGFDLLFGLGPRLKLITLNEHASEKARHYVASHNVGWAWGVSVLNEGRCERLMPDEVAARMSAAQGNLIRKESLP